MVELLAPAGDMQALKVAINNGANAVYLGLQKFNARVKADNFNEQNIKDVVKFAHLHNVKVYLTVNTLVKNSEINELIDTVKSAVLAGVDAYLVQDFGVAKILRECFPNINLHASTQMGIHNLKGALVAESMGITRIVLSREVKLEDIIEIKKNTNLEIEYFVQGALCVAFSGNCYFSAFANNDSGNRGMCKQLCRMQYSYEYNGKRNIGGYMLSPSDLCLIKNLQQLIDAGVCSFKIEGRLRRAGYVGQTVYSYRKAIDCLSDKDFRLDTEIFNLRKVFSRGDFNYNAYLIPKVPDNIINTKTQNHLGIEIGCVKAIMPFKDLSKVTIESKQELHTGDGLKMLDGEKQVVSLGVGNVEKVGKNLYNIYTKHKLKVGYKVFLILDFMAEQKFIDKEQKINIDIQLNVFCQKPIEATITLDDIQVNLKSNFICEKANNMPLDKNAIAEQFTKLGDTYFVCNNIDVNTDNCVFIPKSLLNEFRRMCIATLEDKVLELRAPKAVIDEKKIKNIDKMLYAQNKQVAYTNIVIVDENMDIASIDTFNNLICLAPTKWNNDIVKDFVNKIQNATVALNLPIIANTQDLKIIDENIDDNKDVILIANNIYGLYYLKQNRRVIIGAGLNMFNNFARINFLNMGAEAFILSVEQSLDNFRLTDNDFVYTLGYFALMNFCHCPFKTVNKNTCQNCSYGDLKYINERNDSFKIRRTIISQCYFELLNSHLINNLSKHNFKKVVDLRNIKFNDSDISKIFNNEYIQLADKETIGKIENSVN